MSVTLWPALSRRGRAYSVRKRSLANVLAALHSPLVPPKQPPAPPPWGVLIRQRREHLGRSIRGAALLAGLSDAYWGQVEKGYVTVRGEHRPVNPDRGTFMQIAESLRMTERETAELLSMAGKAPAAGGERTRGPEINLAGLAKRDLILLSALADRLRESAAQEPEAPRLRRVARKGSPNTQDPGVER